MKREHFLFCFVFEKSLNICLDYFFLITVNLLISPQGLIGYTKFLHGGLLEGGGLFGNLNIVMGA